VVRTRAGSVDLPRTNKCHGGSGHPSVHGNHSPLWANSATRFHHGRSVCDDLGHPLLLSHVGRVETPARNGVRTAASSVFNHPLDGNPALLFERLGKPGQVTLAQCFRRTGEPWERRTKYVVRTSDVVRPGGPVNRCLRRVSVTPHEYFASTSNSESPLPRFGVVLRHT